MILSIIIPFYKGEKFIQTLLLSIRNSYFNSKKKYGLEVILIIDSPETTNTSEIEKICARIFSEINIDYIILINNENLGVDKSRDIGVKKASGDFITFIDQDDFIAPLYFSVLENYLNTECDFFLLNGYIRNVFSNKCIPVYYFKPKLLGKNVMYSNPVISPSFIVVKKTTIQKYSLHFELPFSDYNGVDDWFFIIQLCFISGIKYCYVNKKMIFYNIHLENTGHDISNGLFASLSLLKSIECKNAKMQKIQTKAISLLTHEINFREASQNQNYIKSIFFFLRKYIYDGNRAIRLFYRNVIHLKTRY